MIKALRKDTMCRSQLEMNFLKLKLRLTSSYIKRRKTFVVSYTDMKKENILRH